MAEWLGGFLQGWPMWAVLFIVIVGSVVWFLAESGVGLLSFQKKEWWQDRVVDRKKVAVKKRGEK